MSWPGYSRGDLFAIAVGGVVGASVRWLLTRTAQASGGWFRYAPNTNLAGSDVFTQLGFPGRTLLVNMLGCLLLGTFTLLSTRTLPVARRWLVGAAVGFCGSLTTFSTFAFEIAERLRGAGGDGVASNPAIGTGLLYLGVSIVGGALAFWLGRLIAQRLVPEQPTTGDLA